MQIDLEFIALYIPSFNPGGDNPGGAAEGELHSVIEFIMPTDELRWFYDLRIDETVQFGGSSHVVFENVTQGELLLDLTAAVSPTLEAVLSANTSDLMRLTTNMSGRGETAPAPLRKYVSRFRTRTICRRRSGTGRSPWNSISQWPATPPACASF